MENQNINSSVGRYRILEQLGQGGMAVVFKAHDTLLDRDVAIKVIRKGQFGTEVFDRIKLRFVREARSMAKLSHPNIVRVLDFGEWDGAPYLVMEYCSGGTLRSLSTAPIPWQRAVQLIIPIARALAYAHSEGIIHRDIKPSNILLDKNGQPMLSDFGIAKLLEVDDGQTITATGVGVGTPEYMSPEQGMGKEVDGRTDQYSLGIVLFELIAGRKPYQADTPMGVVLKHVTEELPSLRKISPGIPQAVDAVIQRSLSKKPGERFSSMNEFVVALETLMGASRMPAAIPVRPVAQVPLREEDATRDDVVAGPQEVKSVTPQQGKPWFQQKGLIWGGIILVGLIGISILGIQILNSLSTPALSSQSNGNASEVNVEATSTLAGESVPVLFSSEGYSHPSSQDSGAPPDLRWIVSSMDTQTKYPSLEHLFNAAVNPADRYSIIKTWCAVDMATLLDNLSKMSAEIYIDGKLQKQVLLSSSYEQQQTDGASIACVDFYTVAAGWSEGDFQLDVKLNILETLNDGWDTYAPGYMMDSYLIHSSASNPTFAEQMLALTPTPYYYTRDLLPEIASSDDVIAYVYSENPEYISNFVIEDATTYESDINRMFITLR